MEAERQAGHVHRAGNAECRLKRNRVEQFDIEGAVVKDDGFAPAPKLEFPVSRRDRALESDAAFYGEAIMFPSTPTEAGGPLGRFRPGVFIAGAGRSPRRRYGSHGRHGSSALAS